jgi:uncharacterized protein YchJ
MSARNRSFFNSKLNLCLAAVMCCSISFQVAIPAIGKEVAATNSNGSASRNQSFVLEALQSFKNGELSSYQDVLKQALSKDPNNSLLRAYLGYVLQDNKWVTIEESWNQPKLKNAWKDYVKLRDQAQSTVESQMAVADFCKRNGLKDQERVHLFAVIDLDQANTTARQRLGFEKVGDQWMLPAEIEESKIKAAQIAKAFREHKGELTRLYGKFKSKQISHSQAVEELLKNADAAIIPAWELIFSGASSEGSLVVIDALKQVPAPEASLSLVRHALFGQTTAVKDEAVFALKSRDLYSFVPALLRELKGPWVSSVEVKNAPGQRLMFRYSLFADNQSKQELMEFDHTFYLTGDKLPSQIVASEQASAAINLKERVVTALNAVIAEYNKLIIDLLVKVTDLKELDSPQEWWTWWNEKNDVIIAEKSVIKKTVKSESEASGVYVDVPLNTDGPKNKGSNVGRNNSSSPNTNNSGIRTGFIQSAVSTKTVDFVHSCLPAGTPIWTNTGKASIDRIKVGDSVLTQNIMTGELVYKPVLKTTVRPPSALVHLQIENETIRATAGHPFWVIGQGWTAAGELKPGMMIHAQSKPCAVIAVTKEEKLVKTFNLIVDENHSYFVGDHGILSHDISPRVAVAFRVPGVQATVQNATTVRGSLSQ